MNASNKYSQISNADIKEIETNQNADFSEKLLTSRTGEVVGTRRSASFESTVEDEESSGIRKEDAAVTGDLDSVDRNEYPEFYAKKKVHNNSLEDQASCLSNWFLSYLSPLLRLGSTKVLEAEDIGAPSKQDRAANVFKAIGKTWAVQTEKAKISNEKRKKKYDESLAKMSKTKRAKAKPFVRTEPSVAAALYHSFGPSKIIMAIMYYNVSALLQFLPVMILEDLVRYFETMNSPQPDPTIIDPWLEVVALAVLPMATSILQIRSQIIFQHMAIFARTAVSTLLYEKSLTISAAGKACTNSGQVMNMMSNDTTQLQRFIQFGGTILVAPLRIVLSLALIYRQVGSATWVGVGFMLALAPVNVFVFRVVGNMTKKILKYSDLRVKLMNEILAGIRIIKLYALEKSFKSEVISLREKELKALTNLAYTAAIGNSLILQSVPIIQPILVFLTYIKIQDEPLSAATAFTTLALFNIMRGPFFFLPRGLLQYIQSEISLRRIGNYLQLPDLEKYVVNENVAVGGEPGTVTFNNASFSWTNRTITLPPIDARSGKKKKKGTIRNGSSHGSVSSQGTVSSTCGGGDGDYEQPLVDMQVLRDISVTIKAGDLVAVVGAVGSGKSSFLSAILGELEPLNGSTVSICRDTSQTGDASFISYCSQAPWVVNDTLRGNVLFGREFNQDRYDEVIKACALLDDLAVLPAGDKTEIGERGINLSGGQKARVSLARALYDRNTRLVLLDDPLSAVDAHVGEHLFENAIAGNVCRGATRILVTHHVHFLPKCDKVIVLEEGKLAHYGNFSDLIEQGVDFAGAVDFAEKEDGTNIEAREISEMKDVEESKSGDEGGAAKKEKAKMKKQGENLTTKEEHEEGEVGGTAYVHYARAGGMFRFFSMFVIQGLGRGSGVMAAFWLAHWADTAIDASLTGYGLGDEKTAYFLNIYAAFGILGVACLTAHAVFMAVHRLHASRKLHDNLTSSIMRAPVSFFDVTPTGRVLNRFAADMDKIDLDLTQSVGQGMEIIFNVLGALGAISIATKGSFLVPLIPIGYVYYIIQKWFRKTSTELQRVTNIAGSPIFVDFTQVLTGTSTIRAYDEQSRFFSQCQNSFDKYNASFNLVYMCNYWLGLRLDILGGCISAFIGGVAVLTSKDGLIPAGWLGLALSYAIEITDFLRHGVRMMATIEADMNSVERVLYYTQNVEPEAPDIIPENDPVSGEWPSAGNIEIKNGSMRYRDGPLVLKNVSIQISGGSKIGVVGRTGSGKSSLMNLLFRINEIESDGGTITIDGLDTSEIGTEVLRTNLSIIPQDPVMFSNTVRYNIDPFGSSTESEMLDVLQKVQLLDFINALPGGLDEQVSEGGENFSQGQRQLLCIARSLLRRPKILVMDEATASIDNATDAAIQGMIRDNFKSATVLTIAHRLNTILDSDRVLVLDDGRVAEFDTPGNLLAKQDGIFRSMVEKSRSKDK